MRFLVSHIGFLENQLDEEHAMMCYLHLLKNIMNLWSLKIADNFLTNASVLVHVKNTLLLTGQNTGRRKYSFEEEIWSIK